MTNTAYDPFLGTQAKVGAIAEVTYGTTPSTIMTNTFAFVSETLKKRGNVVERQALRGTRAHIADDARVGSYHVGGNLTLEPTPADLNFWLPYILGGSAGSWALAETLPSLTVGVSRGEESFLYKGGVVNRATFSGSATAMLRLSLDLVFQDEVNSAVTQTTESVTPPYLFSDQLVLTLDSVAWPIQSFELTIDNGLITDRFLNSLTIVSAPSADRNITLRTVHPWNSVFFTDLYDTAQPAGLGSGSSGGSLVLTNPISGSTSVLTFTFGNLTAPADPATAAQRAENYVTQNWYVRKTGSVAELVVTSVV